MNEKHLWDTAGGWWVILATLNGESYCRKSTLQVSDCGRTRAKEMLNSPVQALRASWRVREKKEGSEILNQRCIVLPLVESLSQSGNPTLRSDERKSSKMWDSVWFRALEEGKGQNRHPCSGVARNTRCSPELSSSCASRRGVGWLMCGERREKKRWRGGGSERERVREGRGGHSAGARMSDTDNKSTQTFNARFHWACPDHAVQAIEREGGETCCSFLIITPVVYFSVLSAETQQQSGILTVMSGPELDPQVIRLHVHRFAASNPSEAVLQHGILRHHMRAVPKGRQRDY